jgi:hypothetical protein
MPHLSHRATVLIAAVASVAGLVSCKSEQQKQEEAMWYMDTPLPHDPMDKDVLSQWWSNGKQLLRLQENHYYALYENNSRYGRQRERGRWDQDGYALLWLDPYNTIEPSSARVSITKIDGTLAVIIPGLEPMFALKGPPPSSEDQLIGAWHGSPGVLQLNPNMTYSLAPASGATVAGRPLAGHSGKWKLTAGEITLTPSTPSVPITSLTVREEPVPPIEPAAGATQPEAPDAVLEGFGGQFVKVKNAST